MQHHAQRLMSALALAAAVSLWAAPGAAALAPDAGTDVYYDPYGIAYFAVEGEELPELAEWDEPAPEEPEEPTETPQEPEADEEEPAADPVDPDPSDEPEEDTTEEPEPPADPEDTPEEDTPQPDPYDAEETISVQVSWGAMAFTYGAGTWDPDALQYYNGDGWEPANDNSEGNKIEIQNTGTKTVTVDVAFTTDNTWLTAEFVNDAGTKASVDEAKFSKEFAGSGTKEIYYLKLYGMPPQELDSGTRIGTITVSLRDSGAGTSDVMA